MQVLFPTYLQKDFEDRRVDFESQLRHPLALGSETWMSLLSWKLLVYFFDEQEIKPMWKTDSMIAN